MTTNCLMKPRDSYKDRIFSTSVVGWDGIRHIEADVACGKYRFNKLEFGEVAGLPRLLDIGQCNDAYSAVKISLALADGTINDLPLSLIITWYEQKVVDDLLALLSLGVKGIYLGPTLPAFLSPNVLQFLVETFEIKPISTPEEDLKQILG